MNISLLNPEVQKFICEFDKDPTALAFSGSPFNDVSVQELITQIESRRKAQKKLPTWFSTKNILFPPKLNLEQTSSEITAAYKARLFASTNTIDITGGFGIDSYYFAKHHRYVTHVEQNKALAKLVKHNAEILNIKNISVVMDDGLEVVKQHQYDLIYIDPSRRNNAKGKVFFLEDCDPNVPENLDLLFKHSDQILIKTSPMLDINVGLNELSNVSCIHIVAVNNEVKELLWILKKGNTASLIINTVNINSEDTESFNFTMTEIAEANYNTPQKYLYEPNAAILKSGGFDLVSSKLKIAKLHKHSHLYTHNTLIDFPGRSFIIEKIIPYSKAEMRLGITFDKANITTRNFPETVQQIRKKWKIKDGGTIYLFFTTVEKDKKMMLICSKIKK